MAIDKNAKEIFKEIAGIRELLKEDLDAWDPRTVPGKRAQHGQARARLSELENEYAVFVGKNAAAIFVDGDLAKVAEFAKLAEEKGGTVTIDGRGIYKVLVDEVFPVLRRNQIDYDHVANLHSKLSRISASVRYFGRMDVDFTRLMDRLFFDEGVLMAQIRALVEGGVGAILQQGYVSKQIVDRAFASETATSPVPCVILNASEDDKAALSAYVFHGRVIDVKVESDVVPYTVTKAFNELKKQLKSLNTTNEEPTNTEE